MDIAQSLDDARDTLLFTRVGEFDQSALKRPLYEGMRSRQHHHAGEQECQEDFGMDRQTHEAILTAQLAKNLEFCRDRDETMIANVQTPLAPLNGPAPRATR